MKVLGICGSTRLSSVNNEILRIASRLLPPGTEFVLFQGLQDIPHFDPGSDAQSTAFTKFREALAAADAVIISTPEYAFGIPAVLKNALEWTVGVSGFNEKPTALITASTSGAKGHQAMLWVLEAVGTKMNADSQLLIPFIRAKMDDGGNVTNPQALSSIKGVVEALVQLVETPHAD